MARLAYGSHNQEVGRLQTALNAYIKQNNIQVRGIGRDNQIEADTRFGRQTKAALEAVQRHQRKTDASFMVDGIFGQQSAALLAPLMGGATTPHDALNRPRTEGVTTRGRQPTPRVANDDQPSATADRPHATTNRDDGATTTRRSITAPAGRTTTGWPNNLNVERTAAQITANIRAKGGTLSDSRGITAAITAVRNQIAEHPGSVRRPYMMFTDMGIAGNRRRGYILDLRDGTVTVGPFHVAHGQGSGPREGIPTDFRDVSGQATTVLGLTIGGGSAPFTGHMGKRVYHSTKILWEGVTPGMNTGVARDGKWTHGAPYLPFGRSNGCNAVSQDLIDTLVNLVADGGTGFTYSPRAGRGITNVR